MQFFSVVKATEFLSKFSVKQRLFFVAGMCIFLLIVEVALQNQFSRSIENALRDQEKILELNSSINKRYEIALSVVAHWNQRANEEYDKSQRYGKNALDWLLKKSSMSKNTKKELSSLNQTVDSLFSILFISGEKKHTAQTLFNEYITNADKATEDVKKWLENREADLQLEGARLSQQESEFLNVARDGKILTLTTITFLNKLQQETDTAIEKQFSNFMKNSFSILDAFSAFAVTVNEQVLVDNANIFKESFKKARPLSDSLFSIEKDQLKIVTLFKNTADKAVRLSSELLSSADSKVNTTKSVSTISILMILCISIVLMVVVSYLLISSITKPIHELITHVEALGKGDLSLSIRENGNDEISKIAKSLKATINNLREMVTTLNTSSSSLGAHSEQTKIVVDEVTGLSEKQNHKTSQLNDSASVITMSVKEIAETTTDLSSAVNNIAASIEEMSASIGDVSNTCVEESKIALNADESAQLVQTKMQNLGSSADQIGEVITVIKGIAEKTNLLALNASIEAATAGAAGRGFTVVAHEVKALALQTTKATDDIRTHINSMQKTTREAIKAINDIVEIIHRISTYSNTIAHAVQEQKTTVNEIAQTMSNASVSAGKIAENTRSSSKNLDEISGAITDVDLISNQSQKMIGEINVVVTQLSNIGANLNNMIHQFKL